LDKALASYSEALALQPHNAIFYLNRGTVFHSQKKPDLALEDYDQSIAYDPQFASAYYNRGNALQDLKRKPEALEAYQKAIDCLPDNVAAYYNQGCVFKDLGQFEEAIKAFDKAIAIQPNHAQALCNRGVAFNSLNQHAQAIASYDRAIAADPNYAESYCNKALAELLTGNFEAGWRLYEWRWAMEKMAPNVFATDKPLWTGKEPLKGKTILLTSEQGLGDTLQFSRYARLVKQLGAKVILVVQPTLVAFLTHLEGVDQIITTGDAVPALDYHCPLLSLPLAFDTQLTTIPLPSVGLKADPEKVAAWQKKLGPQVGPRVGVVWSGSPAHENDHNRSLSFSQLLAVLPSGITYVSLQKEHSVEDLKQLKQQAHFMEFSSDIESFADTAALCECVDMVISVDTSVAHLAGALNKPLWVLLPYCPDWRWLTQRDDSPWYPSATLLRQKTAGDWSPVLSALQQTLRGLL
jgi:tetratricopeptide (TPR) repeat protein